MSTRTQVWFDGTELTQWAIVGGWNTQLLPRETSGRDVPGMDGTIFTGVRILARTITVRMALTAEGHAERQWQARSMAAALASRTPARLAASIDDGLYYMAVATSTPDMTRMTSALAFDVTFECADPVAYGRERTVAVPSGGSVSFTVGGTYPTMPRVSAPEAANGSGGLWSLALEDGTRLDATIPSGLSKAPVVADCAARTLTVNGSVALLRPAADWLVLEPGAHTLTMTGTGAATVTFDERWL